MSTFMSFLAGGLSPLVSTPQRKVRPVLSRVIRCLRQQLQQRYCSTSSRRGTVTRHMLADISARAPRQRG